MKNNKENPLFNLVNVAEFLNICYKSRMPRQARIDVPGHLYHVMVRSIERDKIFVDGDDYIDFLPH